VKNKLELTWVGKYDEETIEPRLLIEDKSKSYGEENTDNMLIHGDNLLALKALESKFANKIKCVYIDPPYNTGSAFENYDDNLEHSIWLNLMKKRLEILWELLSPDGSIVVQIGFDEMAYLKVLMDEIFGRDNCFGQVAVRMSHSAGMKRKAADKRLIKNTEYILFYYKETLPEIKPIYEISYEYPVNYYQYIQKFPTENSVGEYTNFVDILYEKFEKEFIKYDLKKKNESIKILFANSNEVRNFIMENKRNIVRKDSNAPKVDINIDLENNEFIEYKTEEKTYYIGKNSSGNVYQIYSLEEKVREVEQITEDGEIEKVEAITNLLGDWWDNFYKDMSRVDIEGNVKMKTSKKPERLIYRVFDLLTKPNDIVLDSFLGSATTTAVAHKMNRRWIGIEFGDHCYTLSKTRMDNVINGDKTGISKIVNWKSGGGYKFYELAPSLINFDSFGEPVINKEYNPEMLAATVALHEGFKYEPSEECFWKQSKGNEQSYLYVTTKFLDCDTVDNIAYELKKDEYLIIACMSYDKNNVGRYKNIKIKKIPEMLLSKCSFEQNDYSFNIINLPEYDEDFEGVSNE